MPQAFEAQDRLLQLIEAQRYLHAQQTLLCPGAPQVLRWRR
jgi:hypothetical protein